MPDWLLIVLTVLWLLGSALCGLCYAAEAMNPQGYGGGEIGMNLPLLHTVTSVTVLGVPLLLGWAALANGVHAWPAALYLVPHTVAVVVFAPLATAKVVAGFLDTRRTKKKLREGTRQFLEDGEKLLTAFRAHPRRAEGFEATSFEIKDNMALAFTQRRILSLELGWQDDGGWCAVTALLAAAPLSDVAALKQRRRLSVGSVITLTVHGHPFTFAVFTRTNLKVVARAAQRSGRP